METKNITLGILILLLSIAGIYTIVNINDNLKIDIGPTTSVFYIGDNSSGENVWIVGGTESFRLFNSTAELVVLNYSLEDFTNESTNTTTIIRTTYYTPNIYIKDVYFFDGNNLDIKDFPVSHDIYLYNVKGLHYKYIVNITRPEKMQLTVDDSYTNYSDNSFNYYFVDYNITDINGTVTSFVYDNVHLRVKLFDPVFYGYTYTYSNAPDVAPSYSDGSFTKLKDGATNNPESTNNAVGWHSTTAKYVLIDLLSPTNVTEVVLYPGEQFTGTNSYAPTSYTVSSSTDGVGYTSRTSGAMGSGTYKVNISLNITARYWKVDWSGSVSDWQMWREISFFNYTAPVYIINYNTSTTLNGSRFLSVGNVTVNVTSNLNGNLSIWLYNVTGGVYSNYTVNNVNQSNITFMNLPVGNYSFNAYINKNSSSQNYTDSRFIFVDGNVFIQRFNSSIWDFNLSKIRWVEFNNKSNNRSYYAYTINQSSIAPRNQSNSSYLINVTSNPLSIRLVQNIYNVSYNENLTNGVRINNQSGSYFNGKNTRVNIEPSMSINNQFNFNNTENFTMLIWVYENDYVRCFNKNSSYNVGLIGAHFRYATHISGGVNSTCLFAFGVRNQTGSLQNSITSQNTSFISGWNMVTSIKDDTNITLNVNNNIRSTRWDNQNITLKGLSKDFAIGSENEIFGGNGKYLNATVGKVLVYNRSLNTTEIATEYSLGPNTPTTNSNGLIVQYLFNRTENYVGNSTNIFDTKYLTNTDYKVTLKLNSTLNVSFYRNFTYIINITPGVYYANVTIDLYNTKIRYYNNLSTRNNTYITTLNDINLVVS